MTVQRLRGGGGNEDERRWRLFSFPQVQTVSPLSLSSLPTFTRFPFLSSPRCMNINNLEMASHKMSDRILRGLENLLKNSHRGGCFPLGTLVLIHGLGYLRSLSLSPALPSGLR